VAIGYRAVLQLSPTDDAVKVANEQAREWLKGKTSRATFREWDGDGVHRFGSNLTLTSTTLIDERDDSARQLLRLNETNSSGRWVVSILACSLPKSRREQQTLVIEVDRPDLSTDEALAAAKPPRIVKQLLDRAAVHDGGIILTSTPTIVRLDGIDEAIAAITDEDRVSSVVVAGSPGQVSDELWKKAVEQLTNDSVGVSTAFAISDAAFDEFAGRLPESHGVRRGGVRTYAPRVRLDDPEDSVRHRNLGAETFARSIKRGRVGGSLPIVHAQRARRRLVELELPTEIRRSYEALIKRESAIERDAEVLRRAQLVAPPVVAPAVAFQPPQVVESSVVSDLPVLISVGDEVVEAQSAPVIIETVEVVPPGLVALLERWIGVGEITPSSLGQLEGLLQEGRELVAVADEQIGELQDKQAALNTQIDELREERDDIELAARYDSDESMAARREARILRQRLMALESFESTYVEPETEDDEWATPGSFEDLVLLLDPAKSKHLIARRVVFTGNESPTTDIDKRDTVGRVISKMWEFACVLHDYAELRSSGYDGGVHQYLTDPKVTSRKCSPQRHAAGESQSVESSTKMRQERIFPVPTSVSESGYAEMMAHFKPTQSDTFAPRMHYYDDTSKSGKIYIGYIGRHLTNTKSGSA
jgi:hypothetical protein